MHHKKHLSFTALRKSLSEHFRQIDDRRQSAKVDYRLHDCLMSGFAMMFFQDPSLLAFQQRLHDGIQRNNLTTIFTVSDIPKDTQMRSVLDAIAASELDGIFADFLHRLQRGKHLANYQFSPVVTWYPLTAQNIFLLKKFIVLIAWSPNPKAKCVIIIKSFSPSSFESGRDN